jgi:hypothetical protein
MEISQQILRHIRVHSNTVKSLEVLKMELHRTTSEMATQLVVSHFLLCEFIHKVNICNWLCRLDHSIRTCESVREGILDTVLSHCLPSRRINRYIYIYMKAKKFQQVPCTQNYCVYLWDVHNPRLKKIVYIFSMSVWFTFHNSRSAKRIFINLCWHNQCWL